MAESTLKLTLTELRVQVAYKLGYGRAYPSGTNQQNHVNAVVDRALALVYWHPIYPEIPEIKASHKWSFLEPKDSLVAWDTTTGTISSTTTTTIVATTAIFYDSMVGHTLSVTGGSDWTITATNGTHSTAGTTATVSADPTGETGVITVTADGDYRLPDDWGGIVSRMVYDSSTGRAPLQWVAPEQILQLRNEYTSTGYPTVAAVIAVSNDGTDGQRWNLMLHPTPGGDYTFNYQYSVLPDALSASATYPYGGTQFREVLMAACEAVCEMEKLGHRAGMWANFVSALHSAILRDRESTGGKEIGKNTCPEEYGSMSQLDWLRKEESPTVTYNGVDY